MLYSKGARCYVRAIAMPTHAVAVFTGLMAVVCVDLLLVLKYYVR